MRKYILLLSIFFTGLCITIMMFAVTSGRSLRGSRIGADAAIETFCSRPSDFMPEPEQIHAGKPFESTIESNTVSNCGGNNNSDLPLALRDYERFASTPQFYMDLVVWVIACTAVVFGVKKIYAHTRH